MSTTLKIGRALSCRQAQHLFKWIDNTITVEADMTVENYEIIQDGHSRFEDKERNHIVKELQACNVLNDKGIIA